MRMLLGFLILWLASWNVIAAGDITALAGGRIIDGLAKQPLEDSVILVQGERITAITNRAEIPDGATVIDLGGATLLPGLIDSHAHPLMAEDDYQTFHLQNSSAYKALKGYRGMQNQLQAGWTTLRIAGDADVFYANQDLERLRREGVIHVPRLFGAAHYLSITGGGGDLNYFSPEQGLHVDGLVVDGPEEIRKAIRTEAKYGSDWVKVLVTGAFMSVGDDPRSVQFSEDELKAVVDEANRQGMPVMAHAHATEGIKMAVRLGVRSIEHGRYLDAEGIKLMRKHGTYYVPTIYVGDYYMDPRNGTLRQQDAFNDYSENYRHIFIDLVGKAHRAGVKIAVGLDLGGYNYNASLNARELQTLMEAGMTGMEAIKAATSVPAEMLYQEGQIGSLQVGAYADIIAVTEDPLANISALERVSFVMSNGVVIQNQLLK